MVPTPIRTTATMARTAPARSRPPVPPTTMSTAAAGATPTPAHSTTNGAGELRTSRSPAGMAVTIPTGPSVDHATRAQPAARAPSDENTRPIVIVPVFN